jgi:hypothetical protein
MDIENIMLKKPLRETMHWMIPFIKMCSISKYTEKIIDSGLLRARGEGMLGKEE